MAEYRLTVSLIEGHIPPWLWTRTFTWQRITTAISIFRRRHPSINLNKFDRQKVHNLLAVENLTLVRTAN